MVRDVQPRTRFGKALVDILRSRGFSGWSTAVKNVSNECASKDARIGCSDIQFGWNVMRSSRTVQRLCIEVK